MMQIRRPFVPRPTDPVRLSIIGNMHAPIKRPTKNKLISFLPICLSHRWQSSFAYFLTKALNMSIKRNSKICVPAYAQNTIPTPTTT